MTRHHTLAGLATATLFLALPLAACTTGATEDPTTTPTTTSQAPPPTTDPADLTPQQRIKDYFEASDANSAAGWTDSSYVEEYLVPELADLQKESDAENAETGAVITGDRKLSHWTTVEETDTTTTIEFCDDISDREATLNGEPYEIDNAAEENVAQFTLVREDAESPWMIESKGYYEEGTSCSDHFAD